MTLFIDYSPSPLLGEAFGARDRLTPSEECMSEKSRARRIASALNLSYQQALQRLRDVAPEVGPICERTGWSRARAETFLIVDRARVEDDFIGVRSIWQETCDSCNEPYWNGADKKHITQVNHDRFCPSCLDSEEVNPCLRCGEPHEGRTYSRKLCLSASV